MKTQEIIHVCIATQIAALTCISSARVFYQRTPTFVIALRGLRLSVTLMHSLRLPRVPPLPPSFKRHRFDSDPSRFSLNLSLSKPIPTPCWASLPSPPMSGSPPPEHPLELPQVAGRRRKRSDTPTTHAPSPASTPVVSTAAIVSESHAESYGDVIATTGVSIQPATWPTPYPISQSFGFGTGTSAPTGPTPSSFQPHYAVGPTSPRGTRKSKVHVPSACVNCKKKHLRCDNSRPCHRCVQTGKEVSHSLYANLVSANTAISGQLCRCSAQKKRSPSIETR